MRWSAFDKLGRNDKIACPLCCQPVKVKKLVTVAGSWFRVDGVYDASVCDCCGDLEVWYGVPGEHYGPDDPPGPSGPYVYNGGLCECH